MMILVQLLRNQKFVFIKYQNTVDSKYVYAIRIEIVEHRLK